MKLKQSPATFENAGFLAQEVAKIMSERLGFLRLAPECILNLGAGTLQDAALLNTLFPKAHLVQQDPSFANLHYGKARGRSVATPICADPHALPILAKSLAMVWSNFFLHHAQNLSPLVQEIARVLKDEGLFFFSLIGKGSFSELEASFADEYAHIADFPDLHNVGDLLMQEGFENPVLEVERITLTYPDLATLFTDLRSVVFSHPKQRKTLTGKHRWQAMCTAYEAQRQEGQLPVSLEIILGHAWKAKPTQIADGRAIIRFER